eukprot:6464049-Amphidinium_carterae.1
MDSSHRESKSNCKRTLQSPGMVAHKSPRHCEALYLLLLTCCSLRHAVDGTSSQVCETAHLHIFQLGLVSHKTGKQEGLPQARVRHERNISTFLDSVYKACKRQVLIPQCPQKH